MAKVKRQARSDETRAAIMDAGTYLFGVKGFEKTGIRDIAERSGTNPALISYHFGSKAGLFDEIFAEAVEIATEAASQTRFDELDHPEKELVRIYARTLSAHPMLATMSLRSQLDSERVFNANLLPLYSRFRSLTRQMLAALPEDAKGKDYDPDLVYAMIVPPLQLFLVSKQMREVADGIMEETISARPVDEFVEKMGDFLTAALR